MRGAAWCPRSGGPRRLGPRQGPDACAVRRKAGQFLQQAQVALTELRFGLSGGDRDDQDIVQDRFEPAGLQASSPTAVPVPGRAPAPRAAGPAVKPRYSCRTRSSHELEHDPVAKVRLAPGDQGLGALFELLALRRRQPRQGLGYACLRLLAGVRQLQPAPVRPPAPRPPAPRFPSGSPRRRGPDARNCRPAKGLDRKTGGFGRLEGVAHEEGGARWAIGRQILLGHGQFLDVGV